MSIAIPLDKLYNPDRNCQYNLKKKVFLDLRGMINAPSVKTKHVDEWLLACAFWRTQRNFQEPTLKYMNVPRRTVIMREIRMTHEINLCSIAAFQLINDRLPVSANEITASRLSFYSNHWQKTNITDEMFNKFMISYKSFCSILSYVSVYEWLAFSADEHGVGKLIDSISEQIGYINESTGKGDPSKGTSPVSINKSFPAAAMGVEEMVNLYVGMGLKPVPKRF
jgi:hypothetical protein